jgi:hypothetical protein
LRNFLGEGLCYHNFYIFAYSYIRILSQSYYLNKHIDSE